jgi:phosphoglycerate-specific signal transduction histidine kinase
MEAVGQLTGGIAHDFNNMLAVVVGGIDLARRRLNGPRREVMIHLTNAMEGATRAAALTRRLLSFARSEPLLPERVDSASWSAACPTCSTARWASGSRSQVDARARCLADLRRPHQLENAILNLAVNARDAMDGTGPAAHRDRQRDARRQRGRRHPRRRICPDQRHRHRLRHDAGSLERAFEPFFTTKPVGKGTGLGLSQIFGFAHQSGGEVGIESEVGKGTTVSIYLPRTEGRGAGPAPPGAAQRGVRRRPCSRRAHPAGRGRSAGPRATVGALEDLDYEPVACASGAEAIAVSSEQEFDLVISDVIMPEMTGPELIRS